MFEGGGVWGLLIAGGGGVAALSQFEAVGGLTHAALAESSSAFRHNAVALAPANAVASAAVQHARHVLTLQHHACAWQVWHRRRARDAMHDGDE